MKMVKYFTHSSNNSFPFPFFFILFILEDEVYWAPVATNNIFYILDGETN